MTENTLEFAERFLRSRISRPEELKIREVEGELHLFRGDDHFARLIPTEKEGIWRMEYFHNLERWECYDFRGSLKECLAFLTEKHHYLFWE